ncbi:MAG: YceI family protein [Acidobacteria bacterium]|nr:YceI family protein [Acidobacteriota bacterium]
MMIEQETSVIQYRLDPSQSMFTVQAFATGLLAGFGHNPIIGIENFVGEVQFAPGALDQASLRMTIKARWLSVLELVIKTRSNTVPRPSDEKTLRDIERIMLNDLLEASRYPDIIFQSTDIWIMRTLPGRYKARIVGDLTMHGITSTAPWINAQVTMDEGRLRAQGEFKLRQSDYKFKPVSVAGGTLKLEDELHFRFDLAGVKF